MADQFTPSKTVADVRPATTVPIQERHVTTEQTSTPDFQNSVNEFAKSANNLGAIGAQVAEKASNAIATQLGGEAGKNPKGNLFPSFSEFDEHFAESYKTQAHATLGLQADKLITDSNLTVSSAPRITPDLIATAQNNISQGLKKIYEQAPTDIRPQLEATYGAAQINQTEQLTKRMISEQHEDRKNNTILANDKNAELAHSLAASGKYDIAAELAKTQASINNSAVMSNVGFTPQMGKVGVDTVRQSAINGRLQYEYNEAEKNKKGDEYLQSLAKRPDWISDADYPAATQSIRQYVSNQTALKSNYEQLTMTDFKARIAEDVTDISGNELQATLDKLSEVNASKLNRYYESAYRKQTEQNDNQTNLSEHWDSPEAHANADEKTKNGTFNSKVDYVTKSNPNISRDVAEVQVASTAAGRIPVFEKTLENKLLHAKPEDILSGANQIQLLNNMEAGQAYAGISQKAKAIAIQFQQQRGSMPDSDLARKITDNLSNIDDTMQKTLDNSWNLQLTKGQAAGLGANVSLGNFALNQVGYGNDKQAAAKFGGAYFATLYGNDLYDQLNSNFMTTRGDYAAALQMTKDYANTHYGETYINGAKQISDSPIEKYLGYKGNEVTPFVQQDLLDQLAPSFEKAKKNYPDDSWETLPLKNGVAEAIRTIKTKDGEKQYRYPINLVGRAGNQWDVVVQTPYGNRNLFVLAPHVGVSTYQPNKQNIDKNLSSHRRTSYIGRA